MRFVQKYEIWILHNFEDFENYDKVVRILLLVQNISLHCFISFWLKAWEWIRVNTIFNVHTTFTKATVPLQCDVLWIHTEKGTSMSLDLTFHIYLLFHLLPRINLFVSLSASENTYYMHITFISHLPFLWDVWTFALSPQCLPNPLNCHGVLQDEFVIQHYCWGWSQSHWDKKDEDNDIDDDDDTDDDNENASVTSFGQSICNFTHFAF